MNKSDDLLPAAEAARFAGYLDQLVPVLRQPARAQMARVYCLGLLAAPGRKSVEPLAGLHGARHGSKLYQALHHFVADARWDDAALLAAVALAVLPAIERHGPIRAWIIDDTALAKKGRHSVGVAAQYSGRLGTTTNCQVAVSLSLANAAASLPVAWRLYLPAAWTSDRQRRLAAGVPAGVRFATKPEIALEQLGAAVARDLPRGVVLADEAYGGAVQFRDGVRASASTTRSRSIGPRACSSTTARARSRPGRQRTFCPRRCGRPCQGARQPALCRLAGAGRPLRPARARGVAPVRAGPGPGWRLGGALLARKPPGHERP